jgi:Holliday junction DNA helicase RuvA
MITFVRGTLVEKQPTRAVLDVGGVGYEVFIPLSSYDRLPQTGEVCRVLTVHHVREDAQQLFGFMTEEERGAFQLLLGITGIGPKLALSALSGLTVRELKAAVVEGDVKRLSSIQGVGRKMAERMVVELRDRIGAAEALEAVAGADPEATETLLMRDAVLALVALGYTQEVARKMVMRLPQADLQGKAAEDVIKMALARK